MNEIASYASDETWPFPGDSGSYVIHNFQVGPQFMPECKVKLRRELRPRLN